MTAIPLRRIEGKYEILEKLREGGMGAIYKVRHRLLDEIRVIKLMRPQLVEDEELKTRFLREARLAIKLRHPNIAQLYDFTVDDDGTAFIVMEFIDGMTLEDVLAFHGPPPFGLALEMARQSLKALGYLHMKGFIHRDISPDNLMLAEDMDGQPLIKLIDLGIAKTLGAGGEGHLTQTGTFLGKIRYSSPEQFGADGAAMVDARGDLYSFGVVLYELLTGRFPIQGRDPSSLIAGHLFRPPLDFAGTDPRGRVPDDLRTVVLKALAKSPDDRYASAQELSRALATFRAPADIADEDLKRCLSRPFLRAGAASLADPGSTQDRLDERFNLEPTPSPGSLHEVAKTAAAARSQSPSQAVRETAGTIEIQLKQGDLLTADAKLRWALDTYGEQPELRTLRDRLQEMQSREAEIQARELAAAVAGVEEALDRGDYRSAEALLYRAEAAFGERSELPPLHERVAEQRRRDLAGIEAAKKRTEEIAVLIAGARDLASREDFKGALKELRRALRLDPGNAQVSALVEETEAASRRRAEEKRREQQIARDVKRIEELLGRGDLDGAEKLLDKAASRGEAEILRELRARLEETRQAAEAAARQRAEAERRARALDDTAVEIRDQLDRGDLPAAGALLDRAVVRFGVADRLREQWERLEELQQAAKLAREEARQEEQRRLQETEERVSPFLAEARQLAAAERFDESLAALRRAAELVPDHAGVRALTREVQTALRWQKEEKRRAAELAFAAAVLEVHLQHGELEEAAELLEKAVAAHGDRGPFPQLRARLATLKRRAQERLAVPEPAPEPAVRQTPDPEDELEGLFEATQAVAELLARREAGQALKELHKVTSRFGDRSEFQELRKRIADILID